MTYLTRHLHQLIEAPDTQSIDEGVLLATPGARVVLGEPGMGKSALMRQLGSRLGIEPVTAVRFMLSKEPAKLIPTGKPVLIDALDEAMARREGDAVDLVLAQLEAAGSPDFILSCRAREWQSRGASNLRQLYGVEPAIFALEPFSRNEAASYLRLRFPKIDAEQVLSHLEGHSLSDLYRNPLTLGLLGQVAQHDTHLPATRAALFERTCTLIWPEHDAERQDGGLAQLTEQQALDAAGAIAAGLLFAGAEAVSLSGAAHVEHGHIRLAELIDLPGGEAVRAVFSSKLFISVGPGIAKPIHRVIAEYLAARWLAQKAKSARVGRRLLAQLHGNGAVPASLRGLHAWLAYHSPVLAERVIAADPYGVLRYGETTILTPRQAGCLFDALCGLANDDPYFRGSDWDEHTAAGLMIPPLASRIRDIIYSTESNAHLRSLLIETLKGSPLAKTLSDALDAVMLSPKRFYRERKDAADALLPYRSRLQWRITIEQLRVEGGEDSTRIARQLIENIDGDANIELIVAVILAEIGITVRQFPRNNEDHRHHTIHHFGRIVTLIRSNDLVRALDLFTDYLTLFERSDWPDQNHTDTHWRSKEQLARTIAQLIVRAIDEHVIGSRDAAALWRWLGTIQIADGLDRDFTKSLLSRLAAVSDLRHAVQDYALSSARGSHTILAYSPELRRRLVGFDNSIDDIARLLTPLEIADNRNQKIRNDWQDLVHLAFRFNGFEDQIRPTLDKFVRGDPQLTAFVQKLENPDKPQWQRDQDRRNAKRQREKRISIEKQRRWYTQEIEAMRAGDLKAIVDPAKVYLGLFSDVPHDAEPGERLTEWLGVSLLDATLTGFEAVLHRTDIPTASHVASGFARGVTYNFAFPITAGLLERIRTGRGVVDLSPDVRSVGLLMCYENHAWPVDDRVRALATTLERAIFTIPTARQSFARLWIEPSLETRQTHIAGIYKLARDPDWQHVGGALAAEWLNSHSGLSREMESTLVECLIRSGNLESLASLASARANTVFRNFDHMLSWLAIDVLVRFQAVQPYLNGIGQRNPDFLWHLRNLLMIERRKVILPLSIPQAAWIVAEFRAHWAYATLSGSGSGDTNPYDATDFLRSLIARIADDPSIEASTAMASLVSGPADSYSDLIRHLAAEQRQKQAEEIFEPLRPKSLRDLLENQTPSNIDDFKSLLIEELCVAQAKLFGEDIDEVRDFWTDAQIPRDENRCRDRLAAMIGPELARFGIQRITEADMPKDKRADLAFVCRQMQLPMEVKGQWNVDVWDAAAGQLDLQYLIDWRSERRGIYCVLWFGELLAKTGRRLTVHPKKSQTPKSADEMRAMLVERIPVARRAMVDVVVLDFTAIKKANAAQ